MVAARTIIKAHTVIIDSHTHPDALGLGSTISHVAPVDSGRSEAGGRLLSCFQNCSWAQQLQSRIETSPTSTPTTVPLSFCSAILNAGHLMAPKGLPGCPIHITRYLCTTMPDATHIHTHKENKGLCVPLRFVKEAVFQNCSYLLYF